MVDKLLQEIIRKWKWNRERKATRQKITTQEKGIEQVSNERLVVATIKISRTELAATIHDPRPQLSIQADGFG
jgi:hypothetical protein